MPADLCLTAVTSDADGSFAAPSVFTAYTLPGGELPLSAPALLELMENVLARGRTFRFCARGSSMLPFIQDGDVISIAPLANGNPGLGDIVAYRSANSRLIVHRVTGRTASAFRIQGDNLPGDTADLVPAGQILGRVTRIERRGKPRHFGLGPERCLIAMLARPGLLAPSTRLVAALYHWRQGPRPQSSDPTR